MYSIMQRCWEDDPDLRPSFTQLVQEIETETRQLEAMAAARKIGLHVTYVNVRQGNYYNSTDGAEAGASATMIDSRQTSTDRSSAGESGFASGTSDRRSLPKRPAAEPSADSSRQVEKAIL